MAISFFLYTSRLAPHSEVSTVGGIVKQARAKNAISAITGILGFDGEMFVQYVEGPTDAVLKLIESLSADSRHTDFNVVCQGATIDCRRFQGWSMGFADLETFPFDIELIATLKELPALQYFLDNAQSMDFA